MALSKAMNLEYLVITVAHTTIGTPTGANVGTAVPVRCQLLEAGFCVNSLTASQMTLQVDRNDVTVSTTASSFTTVITSTIGTFSSTGLFEGGVSSVVPASAVFLNAGDYLRFTTSGGNTSAIAGTVYAVLRKD